jgi:hypothetical protein
MSPQIYLCNEAPKKLQPMNVYCDYKPSFATMGYGLYTKKQKLAFWRFISSGSNAREVVADIGYAFMENKKTSLNLFSLFNDAAIGEFQADIAKRIFGFFANLVNIFQDSANNLTPLCYSFKTCHSGNYLCMKQRKRRPSIRLESELNTYILDEYSKF